MSSSIYKHMYHILFHAVTDSLEHLDRQNFGLAAERLRMAQQDAEYFYLRQDDKRVPRRRAAQAKAAAAPDGSEAGPSSAGAPLS